MGADGLGGRVRTPAPARMQGRPILLAGADDLSGLRAHTVRPYSSNESAFIAGTVPLIRHDLRSCHLPYPLCRYATSSLPLLAYGHFPLTGGIGPLTRGVGPLEGGRLGRAAQCAAPTGEAEHSVAGG